MTKLNPDKTYRNKEWLIGQCIDNKKTHGEIAKECGVCRKTICNFANKYNIERMKKWHKTKDLSGQRFGGCLNKEMATKRIMQVTENNIADMIGKRFGRWLVLSRALNPNPKSRYRTFWLCECACGTTNIVRGDRLRSGDSQSCGCLNKELSSKRIAQWNKDHGRKVIGITGQKFGRWLVLNRAPRPDSTNSSSAYWLCECDCGTLKIIQGSTLRSGGSKSCGCLLKELATKKCGAKNPRWNPDKTDEERQEKRNYFEYREWRNAVYKRDEYKCQKCGKRGGDLCSHHIESYDANRDLRITLDNGVTLCKNCHNNFHHIYGRGNNTREQFDEFMLMEDCKDA